VPYLVSLSFLDHTAGNFCSGVSGWLRVKIIGAAMDDHCSSNDLLDAKTVRKYLHVCVSMRAQQRWQIPRMIGMYGPDWIKMPASGRKPTTDTATALVDMKRKKPVSVFGRPCISASIITPSLH